jgi:hypothetical protein
VLSLGIILPARIREPVMNAFYEHHRDSIRFGYRRFDRILLNGLMQPFQQPERVVGFFNSYWEVYPVSRDVRRSAAEARQPLATGPDASPSALRPDRGGQHL